jgi:hypothetical protein
MTFGNRRYRHIAEAMSLGIAKCGDQSVICHAASTPNADAAVMYGWKLSHFVKQYPQFAYADLGYWHRKDYYRLTVNGWGSESYVKAGLPAERLKSLGVRIEPWQEGGDEILIVGSSRKSALQHGFQYMEWERNAAKALECSGKRVVYRPKPTDLERIPIDGIGYDERPLEEALAKACLVVTHHSNVAVQALAAGVPVHCVTGAGAAFSVPLGDFTRLEGREQFLADVAWLQWSLDEMRNGTCWAHIKERGLMC